MIRRRMKLLMCLFRIFKDKEVKDIVSWQIGQGQPMRKRK